jgi:hypothetical protein
MNLIADRPVGRAGDEAELTWRASTGGPSELELHDHLQVDTNGETSEPGASSEPSSGCERMLKA